MKKLYILGDSDEADVSLFENSDGDEVRYILPSLLLGY